MANGLTAYQRVEAFTARVITEELGGKSYAADAGALATVLDRVTDLEKENSQLRGEAQHIAGYLRRVAELEAALRKSLAYCDDAQHPDSQFNDDRPNLLRVLGNQ